MKRWITGVFCLIGAVVLCGFWTEFRWRQFRVPEIIGSEIAGVGKSEEEACREWFADYVEKLQGVNVPYEYRIHDAQLNQVEILDDDGYVQLDYSIIPFCVNNSLIQNMELVKFESEKGEVKWSGVDSRFLYQGQMVVRMENQDGIYKITEKMRPVEYQIQTPEFQEEIRAPQTDHYAMQADRKETYYIDDEVLYVTFDEGNTFTEVPDGYEKVCREANGSYDENLKDGSYLISEEFTAFIGFDSSGTVLIYSKDQGQSWKESRISDMGFPGNRFLSKIENGCVAVFAVDRSLGTDYYSTWMTEDEKTWNQIQFGDQVFSNVSAAFWTDASTGYYAVGQNQSPFYLTTDQGKTFQEVPLPNAEEVSNHLGYDPFDQIEQFYIEEGNIYMIVGQGDDGDYTLNGKLVKALFKSDDGVNFIFEKEITDSLQEAG